MELNLHSLVLTSSLIPNPHASFSIPFFVLLVCLVKVEIILLHFATSDTINAMKVKGSITSLQTSLSNRLLQ
jgi:hypothetical protein